MGIKATEQPLGKIFTSDYRFVVPAFQRAYTWQTENMRQLVEDLRDASANPKTPYFLGSLILVRDEDNRFQVIDGQQRLVSLTIIIAVLRDLEDDEDLVESLDDLIMEHGDKLRGIKAEPRLRLRDRDAEFFRDNIQAGVEAVLDLREADLATSAQWNIKLNTKQAYDMLADMEVEDRRRFASYLVNQVTLVMVITDDLAGAHRIFDVMNMRGVPLTASDVFKAKAVASLSSASRDAYASRWDDIVEPLGDDPQKTEQFFRSLYMIVTYKAECGQLITDFQSDVLKSRLQGSDEVIEFIDKVLAPYANAWRMVERPTESRLPDDVVGRLVALNDYPADDWKPVAMWALAHSIRNLGALGPAAFTGGGAHSHARGSKADETLDLHDLDRLNGVLGALERVSGIDMLNHQTTLYRRTRFASAIRDLDKRRTLQQIRWFNISDDERRRALAHLRGELPLNDAVRRLLLIRANEQQDGGRITRPRSLRVLRLVPEHIGKNSSFASWPESVRDYWAERIGNLVLSQTGEKQVERVDDYGKRRDQMLTHASSRRFPLTARLADIAELTPKTLEWRQDETVRLIADYWNIRYDAEHVDLSQLSEEHLTEVTRIRKPSSRRVTIAQVLDAGLLVSGETFEWVRPRKGERWVATITDDGKMRMEDGTEYPSPTAAARAVGGSSAGLNVWKRTSNGQKLSDIWKTYRLKEK
ncbi:GmrSD restriction endonuclease domain-containing protein [Bifidobacterium simiarum]|uniref:DUF262 domain-containing protein n=1 Tax=Bifidobacterium simiarum TaxID=2045441 RepID=A0A2M9HEH5_9BIFI|nr:DUF262 domain-containing protein [Bifidobacterium simiarum]PJM75228.1 hypothetical protein CSQ87_06490 [Bifidobacterium simiarum]